MLNIPRATAKRILNSFGLKLSRNGHDWGEVATFIPFAETMAAAAKSGLPLGDYIDARQGIAGTTQATIDKMASFGVFQGPINTVVEIGPGTGRYLEKTLRVCSPARYEVYETAAEWATYVAHKFPVIVQPTDGCSLQATATCSVDLVQAHKVLSSTSFIVTVRYLREMMRVAKVGAHIVFDAMTENCLTPGIVEAWAATGTPNRSSYPAAFPCKIIENFFAAHNAKLIGTSIVPMPPGETELFVFKKS
jgi:hypothetical protein